MKKKLSIIFSTILIFTLAACGNNQTKPAEGVIERPKQNVDENNSSGETDQVDAAQGSKILITYFTVPETDGVDTVANASRVAKDGKVIGNTEFIANIIQETLGGELFAIETEQDYPDSHDPLLEFAYNEKSDNARPKLSSHIDNLSEYDVIFVGFPKL